MYICKWHQNKAGLLLMQDWCCQVSNHTITYRGSVQDQLKKNKVLVSLSIIRLTLYCFCSDWCTISLQFKIWLSFGKTVYGKSVWKTNWISWMWKHFFLIMKNSFYGITYQYKNSKITSYKILTFCGNCIFNTFIE